MYKLLHDARLRLALGWLGALIVAWLLYATGFSGSFIFDDLGNLRGLSAVKDLSLLETGPYVLQGFAGPSGRPLTLLSFALQRESWPHDPAAFKAVNLWIHCFNASLLLILGLMVQRFRQQPVTGWSLLTPLIAATLWLLWPIQVSSVLYVVQRMTLLAATCMCAGLILFVQARTALDAGRIRKAYLLFAMALGVGLPLGILFKESAGVFPLVVLALDATLLARADCKRPVLWSLALWGAVIALAFYLLVLNDPTSGYAVRSFTLYERLLSETRILWMYAAQILLPSVSSLLFIYDDFEISRGFLNPASTALASAGLLAALVTALCYRKRYPVAAFAVLFFLANHALESTFIPLELVFEHRNYLASFGLAVAVGAGIHSLLLLKNSAVVRNVAKLAAPAYLAFIIFVTHAVASLWGDDLSMAASILQQKPDSRRAHMHMAYELLKKGHPQAGITILNEAATRFPDDLAYPLALVDVACYYPDQFQPAALERAQSALKTQDASALTAFSFLDQLVKSKEGGQCQPYRFEDFLGLVELALENPALAPHHASLLKLAGSLNSQLGRVEEARRYLQLAVAAHPKPDLLVQAAVWEISNRNWSEAERYLGMLGPQGPLSLRAQMAIREDREKVQALLETQRAANP